MRGTSAFNNFFISKNEKLDFSPFQSGFSHS